MKWIISPGYETLFGKADVTYEQLLAPVPSTVLIEFLSALNNELNTPEAEHERQYRMILFFLSSFNNKQATIFNQAIQRLKNIDPQWNYSIFGRRYLLSMLAKEVEVNRPGMPEASKMRFEYHFLLAYLLHVDEVNNIDYLPGSVHKDDPDAYYKALWPMLVDQYEFNHSDNGPFGLFKLAAFSKYAFFNLRPFLKEYLQRLNFPNLSHLMSSFFQLTKSMLAYNVNEPLRKLTYINPTAYADATHLDSLSINKMLGKKVSISELRMYPVYKTISGKYMLVDETFFSKKMYNGPYFDLIKSTSLKNSMSYPKFSSIISKEVLEDMCFKSLCRHLVKSEFDCLNFDDNQQNLPDCYYRHNKKLLLIEFKDYFFPDGLIKKPDFENIKSYIDERFIVNQDGKAKGVSQVLNNIASLAAGEFKFDSMTSKCVSDLKTVNVYPIISFSDFMFSIPGVNEYLNKVFNSKLDRLKYPCLNIKPITMINIETLFDYCYRDGNFTGLMELIDRYHKMIRERQGKLSKEFTSETYLRSIMSFDETYSSIYLKELPKKTNSKKRFLIMDSVGLTKENLEEVL